MTFPLRVALLGFFLVLCAGLGAFLQPSGACWYRLTPTAAPVRVLVLSPEAVAVSGAGGVLVQVLGGRSEGMTFAVQSADLEGCKP